jgi:proteasome lid subunit RPN8/RPN11
MTRGALPTGFRARAGVVPALIEAWSAAGGREPCGLLVGVVERGVLRIDRAVSLPNVHPTPAEAFALEPEDQVRAAAEARGAGLVVVGTWHGHLAGGPWPGRMDVEAMEASRALTDALAAPPWVHLVVARGTSARPVVRAFVQTARGPKPVHLRVAR